MGLFNLTRSSFCLDSEANVCCEPNDIECQAVECDCQCPVYGHTCRRPVFGHNPASSRLEAVKLFPKLCRSWLLTSQTFTALDLELCSCPVLYWTTSCSFCCVLTSFRVCFLVCIWVHAPRIWGRVKLLGTHWLSFWGHNSQAFGVTLVKLLGSH